MIDISRIITHEKCDHCKKEHKLTEEELKYIEKVEKITGEKFDVEKSTVYEPVGCKKCNQSGYLNRIGIFEVLNIDDEVRDLIARDGSSMEIRAKALELGYKPLVIDGLKKVLNGITTLDEINNKLIIY